MKLDENLLKEDTLSRWGDALHDYARAHKSRKRAPTLLPSCARNFDRYSSNVEIISVLEQSYEKFKLSIATNNDNLLAHDYWALAMFSHAKLLKSNTEAVLFNCFFVVRIQFPGSLER